jgi:hypothetical protein
MQGVPHRFNGWEARAERMPKPVAEHGGCSA